MTRVLTKSGRERTEAEYLAVAMTMYGEIGMRFWLERTEAWTRESA